MVEHTPGPLRYNAETRSVGYDDEDIGFVPTAVIDGMISDELAAADGKLYAAAPDLLAALEAVYTELTDMHPCDWGEVDACEQGGGSESHAIIRAVEAAIRAARGEG